MPKPQEIERKFRVLAAKQEPALKKAAKSAFLNARDRVALSDLKAALSTGSSGVVEGAVKLDEMESDLGAVITGILAALLAGGQSAQDELDGPGFDRLNTAVQQSVQRQSGLAVGRITQGTRRAIQQAVSRIVSDDLSLEDGAREIRNVIGLTAPQERTLAIQRAAMEKAGVKDSVISRTIDARSKRMLDYRAQVIAENEAFTAISAGRQLYWTQLVDSGELSPRTQRKWITAADEFVCPICAPMHGQVRGMNEFFTAGDGGLFLTSPAHPVCRCSVILVE